MAFALDALSFFISAACIRAMPSLPSLADAPSATHGALGDLRAGLATVIRSPWLWITITVSGVANASPLETVLPLLVRQQFGTRVGVYALLNTLLAAGALTAAMGRRVGCGGAGDWRMARGWWRRWHWR